MKKLSLRTIVQIFMFILLVGIAFLHQYYGIEKMASIDAFCPFGAVESFFTLLFQGEFLKRIYTSSFIILGVFLIGTLFFGRIFCGYFCPLGAMQEWLRKLGKKLGLKKDFEVPKKLDKYLRYLKYIILILIIYFSFYLGDLIFRHYDPYVALMHFGTEIGEMLIAYLILVLIVIMSLFSKSIWCRYFCPLGAFFGIVKKISFLKIKRNVKTCNGCGICNINCPSNIDVKNLKIINDADCISCGKCTKGCPKKSLKYNILGKEITTKMFSILVIILVLIPLLILPFTPIWKSKAQSNIINSQGEINTADIRGSNTLEYLIEITNISLEVFISELGLPENIDTRMKLKEIGSTYSITIEGAPLETEHFRQVVDENYSK